MGTRPLLTEPEPRRPLVEEPGVGLAAVDVLVPRVGVRAVEVPEGGCVTRVKKKTHRLAVAEKTSASTLWGHMRGT